MSQTREAVDRFIASLAELCHRLDLPDAAAVAPQLERCLIAVLDREILDRGVTRGGVTYQQHGIGFALWWPGSIVDVDVDRAYQPPGPRRLVLDPWKIAMCGERLGLATGADEAEEYLHELARGGVCGRTGEHFVWPPASE